MKKWQEYANYKKTENEDGSFTYVITINGEDVEVTEAVYKAYAAGDRKMRYMELDLKCDRVRQDERGKAVLNEHGNPVALPEREMSLDKLIGEDWDFPSSEPSAEDAVLSLLETEALYGCLDRLDADERALIDALFFEGLTIRDYAELTGQSKSRVDREKTRILGKMKKIMSGD